MGKATRDDFIECPGVIHLFVVMRMIHVPLRYEMGLLACDLCVK
jgi:hypothetical protein